MQFWKDGETTASDAGDFHNRVRSKHTATVDIWTAGDECSPGETMLLWCFACKQCLQYFVWLWILSCNRCCRMLAHMILVCFTALASIRGMCYYSLKS